MEKPKKPEFNIEKPQKPKPPEKIEGIGFDLPTSFEEIAPPKVEGFSPTLISTPDPLTKDRIRQVMSIKYVTSEPDWNVSPGGEQSFIYNDGAIDWLYIFSNGAWKKTSLEQIAATSYLGSAQNNITAATPVQVAFDTNVFANGITWDSGNKQFTVVSPGYYFIYTQILIRELEDAEQQIVLIYNNGSEIARTQYLASTTSSSAILTLSCGKLYNLAAGDDISVYVSCQQPGAGATDILANDSQTYMSMFKV